MQRVGSRAQVMHGNAKQTGGGLKKKDLKYNKQGKIVSKKMSAMAKKEKRLQKAGYVTKKGIFKLFNKQMGGDDTLISASEEGNLKVVQEQLDAGADKEATNNNGDTPLIWASINGHLGVVRKLLDAGANVNAKNRNGDTALILASINGHLGVVRKLLDAGADLNDKNMLLSIVGNKYQRAHHNQLVANRYNDAHLKKEKDKFSIYTNIHDILNYVEIEEVGIKVLHKEYKDGDPLPGYGYTSPFSKDKKFSGTIRFRGDSYIRIKSNKIGKDSYDRIYHIDTAEDYKPLRNKGDENGIKFRVNLTGKYSENNEKNVKILVAFKYVNDKNIFLDFYNNFGTQEFHNTIFFDYDRKLRRKRR